MAARVAEIEKACDAIRKHNAITHGIHGVTKACRDFAADLCMHLHQHALVRNALDVAFDRIELRLLKDGLGAERAAALISMDA